jgi:hypothetical protein
MPNESTRTFVSLALFIHLFCVVIVLSGNFLPSKLQVDLSETVGVYTKALHFDPGYVPFHLTDGQLALSRMHQWQVVEQASDGSESIALSLPSNETLANGFTASFGRTRQARFAQRAAFYATNEAVDDEVCAAMAKSLAKHCFATTAQETTNHLVVRCVRLNLMPPTDTTNVDSDAIVYQADVWRSQNGQLNLLKRMEQRRTAPPA